MGKTNKVTSRNLINKDEFYDAEGDMDILDSSSHPVVVDGKEVSKKDWYNTDGDDFYGAAGEEYCYLDANNEQDVTNFQRFANERGANLEVDGKYGNKTRKQYKKIGAKNPCINST